MADVELAVALRRSSQKGFRGVVPYCLPFVVVVFSFRIVTMVVHRYSGRSAWWIEVLLTFAVCYPLNFLAEILVATAYLQEDAPSATPLAARSAFGIFRSDVVFLMARVVVRSVAWLLAFIGFLLVELAIVAIVRKLAHLGSPMHPGKSLNHLLVEVAFVFYAGVCSRYSFVFPLYAFREAWHSDALADGVRLAKEQRRVLWALAMAVAIVLFLGGDLSKWAVAAVHGSRPLDRMARFLQLILGGIVSGYFTVLKTELMRQTSVTEHDMIAR